MAAATEAERAACAQVFGAYMQCSPAVGGGPRRDRPPGRRRGANLSSSTPVRHASDTAGLLGARSGWAVNLLRHGCWTFTGQPCPGTYIHNACLA